MREFDWPRIADAADDRAVGTFVMLEACDDVEAERLRV